MSWRQSPDPICERPVDCDPVETVVTPVAHDIGGLEVRRTLPSAARRMVGPFVFCDRMGPAVFDAGQAIDVRPHPHIGLATITWLLRGEILHRDSLGSVQPIRPGEVNWMTAGAGIVHSERSPDHERRGGAELFGMQTWVALPRSHEETAPSFQHYSADRIPRVEGEGTAVRLVVGAAWGARSPVATQWDTLYADATLDAGAVLELPRETEERAVCVLDGRVEIAGTAIEPGDMAVLRPGGAPVVRAEGRARIMVLGGATMDGRRHIWWNFVSSSRERIEQAKADWREGRFDPVPGETEFIPLPER